jgi:hypothetical protein
MALPANLHERWTTMFNAMLTDYRQRFPEDQRSTRELLDSLCQFLYEQGAIGKSPEGKWLLGEIVDDQPGVSDVEGIRRAWGEHGH